MKKIIIALFLMVTILQTHALQKICKFRPIYWHFVDTDHTTGKECFYRFSDEEIADIKSLLDKRKYGVGNTLIKVQQEALKEFGGFMGGTKGYPRGYRLVFDTIMPRVPTVISSEEMSNILRREFPALFAIDGEVREIERFNTKKARVLVGQIWDFIKPKGDFAQEYPQNPWESESDYLKRLRKVEMQRIFGKGN